MFGELPAGIGLNESFFAGQPMQQIAPHPAQSGFGGYCFDIAVPRKVRQIIGEAKLRKSLRARTPS